MKFERRCRKLRSRYHLGPRGSHNLLPYTNAAKNCENFKQVCIDDGLLSFIFYLLCFPHCKEGWQAKCKQSDVTIQACDLLLRMPFDW